MSRLSYFSFSLHVTTESSYSSPLPRPQPVHPRLCAGPGPAPPRAGGPGDQVQAGQGRAAGDPQAGGRVHEEERHLSSSGGHSG